MSHTKVKFGLIGHSGEPSSVNVYLPEILATGANWPNNFAPVTGAEELIKATLIPMTLMNFTKTTASITVGESVPSLPADPHAQRELALRISYVDTVTLKKYRYDIPGPQGGVIPSGTDEVPLGNALLAAHIIAMEANAVSVDDNPISIYAARIVGRNN